jgi:hypothetical protein
MVNTILYSTLLLLLMLMLLLLLQLLHKPDINLLDLAACHPGQTARP